MKDGTVEGLPEAPLAHGLYVPYVKHHDLVFVSGITPRRNGRLIKNTEESSEGLLRCARVAAENVLASVSKGANGLRNISQLLNLVVYIKSAPEFVEHGKVADEVSRTFQKHLGERAWCARAAVGVTALPSGADIELSVIAKICE